jgi:hypothetical protein
METYVVPQFTASFENGRAASQTWGALELVRFGQNPGASNFQLGTRVDWLGARVRPYGRANLRQTAANPGITEVSEVGRKSTRIERSLTSGIDVRLGRAVGLSGRAEQIHTDWDADAVYRGSSLREKLNRDDRMFAMSMDLFLTPVSAIRVSGSTMSSRFEFSPARNANNAEWTAGLVFRAPAAVVGSLRAGVREVRPVRTEGSPLRGTVWEGTLVHQLRNGGFLFMNLARNVQYTAEPGVDYVLAQTVGLRAAIPLASRWMVGAWWVKDSLEYLAGTSAGTPEGGRSSLAAASVGYRPAQPLTVGMTVERQVYRGAQDWNAWRAVTFLMFGRGPFQRLDRPLPFER